MFVCLRISLLVTNYTDCQVIGVITRWLTRTDLCVFLLATSGHTWSGICTTWTWKPIFVWHFARKGARKAQDPTADRKRSTLDVHTNNTLQQQYHKLTSYPLKVLQIRRSHLQVTKTLKLANQTAKTFESILQTRHAQKTKRRINVRILLRF